jgi:hypothetical protein
MEVCGQLHAPVALPPMKGSPVPTRQKSWWVPAGNGTLAVQPVNRIYTERAIPAPLILYSADYRGD